jgi:transposase InsO family protein
VPFLKRRERPHRPGSPWQNSYLESFGSRIRDELLGVELFSCLAEAKVMVEDCRRDYNERRPRSALQMMALGPGSPGRGAKVEW